MSDTKNISDIPDTSPPTCDERDKKVISVEKLSILMKEFTSDFLGSFPEYTEKLSDEMKYILSKDDLSIENEKDRSFMETIWNNCSQVYPPRFFDILYQNEDIFGDERDENVEFIPGINFKDVWSGGEAGISETIKVTLWKYLQLVLFKVIEDSDQSEFGDTAKMFEAIDETALKDKLEETVKEMEKLFGGSNSNDSDSNSENSENGLDEPSINLEGSLPNAEEMHAHLSGLMEGKLGRLAQDIAEDTAAELGAEFFGDIKSPDEMFKRLIKNPGRLMGLVTSVGGKLEKKIKSGEIKESELLEEAGTFVSKMKDMPGMGNLSQMLGKMGMGNMAGMAKGGQLNMGALAGMMRNAKARDRMRDKLAKKRAMQASMAGSLSNPVTEKGSTFSTGETVIKSKRGDKPTSALKKQGKKKKKR